MDAFYMHQSVICNFYLDKDVSKYCKCPPFMLRIHDYKCSNGWKAIYYQELNLIGHRVRNKYDQELKDWLQCRS
jgi:hypothetical protein